MNDKSKTILMVTIIVLIVVIIGILIMLKIMNKNFKTDVIEYDGIAVVNNELQNVDTRGNYYIVKNIIEKYYLSLCNLNKTADDVQIYEFEGDINQIKQELTNQVAIEIENTKRKIYNLFDKNYIEEIGISMDNIQEKLGNYNNLDVFIKDMYVRDLSEYLKLYFVFGSIIEKDNSNLNDFRLMLILDDKHKTYNIYTSDYIDKYNIYELSKDKDFKMNISDVENRKYNTYKYEYINDETYASDLLKNYIQSIEYFDIDYSYNKLDKEYREKRFNGKSNYEKYISENKKILTNILLDYYKINKYDEYTQLLCVDRKGNYYIFRENAIMDYSLMLDLYTIDLPEFIQEYTKATTENKVKLNIEKITEALNQRDYNYVYSKLVKEFKENNFKTYENFKKYAEATFDIENEITYNQYTETENYCTYKITLKGKNKTITKTIVMKLEEGTDFIMSFNV